MDWVNVVFPTIGAVTGTVGMVLGIMSMIRNRYDAVNEFYSAVEKPDFIAARHFVYTQSNLPLDDENISYVINFFHHWGMMAKKHYLPMWVFNGASGEGVIRLYERCATQIDHLRRINHEHKYGEGFIWRECKVKCVSNG